MSDYSREAIESPEFWESIVPTGTISEYPLKIDKPAYHLSEETLKQCNRQLMGEGYFQTPPLLSKTECNELREIVECLVKANLRPTYSLLFDQFYHVLARLQNLLASLLGENYLVVPNEFEVFHVSREKNDAGTPPHRDSYGGGNTITDDGKFKLINIWVALSDATPLSSCIYVLPAHLDTEFPERHRLQNASPNTGRRLDLQNIRALPAPAGSIIGWNPNLLHWGSRCSNHTKSARVSFAVYFQRGDIDKMHPTATTSNEAELPFDYRLYLVEKVWRDRKGEQLHQFLK